MLVIDTSVALITSFVSENTAALCIFVFLLLAEYAKAERRERIVCCFRCDAHVSLALSHCPSCGTRCFHPSKDWLGRLVAWGDQVFYFLLIRMVILYLTIRFAVHISAPSVALLKIF